MLNSIDMIFKISMKVNDIFTMRALVDVTKYSYRICVWKYFYIPVFLMCVSLAKLMVFFYIINKLLWFY